MKTANLRLWAKKRPLWQPTIDRPESLLELYCRGGCVSSERMSKRVDFAKET